MYLSKLQNKISQNIFVERLPGVGQAQCVQMTGGGDFLTQFVQRYSYLCHVLLTFHICLKVFLIFVTYVLPLILISYLFERFSYLCHVCHPSHIWRPFCDDPTDRESETAKASSWKGWKGQRLKRKPLKSMMYYTIFCNKPTIMN